MEILLRRRVGSSVSVVKASIRFSRLLANWGSFPAFQNDFPFILYTQSVPRPAWSGKRDFHREKLQQVYEFIIQEVTEDAKNTSRSLCAGCLQDTADEACDAIPA